MDVRLVAIEARFAELACRPDSPRLFYRLEGDRIAISPFHIISGLAARVAANTSFQGRPKNFKFRTLTHVGR